ncbi:MAG: PPOX class F420-dependent oxidoreductase [Actinomycetota bacterium]|nr:PPOX class F420-dependent oxidoreductase [Actinomycetota bacterium]
MQKMTNEETRSFISHKTRTGKLAVVRKDGRPLVTPIWFALDGDDIVFMTFESSGKGLAVRRDPRVAMVVDEEVPPYSFVLVEGTVSISEDPIELLHWATVIGRRYMGADRADEYGKRNAVPGELLVRIHPTRIVAMADVSD